MNKSYDLEERLLEYTQNVFKLCETLPETKIARHIFGQVLRSSSAPLSNHAEAEAGESRTDFIHKCKICLKEMRETRRWLKLIRKLRLAHDPTLAFLLDETEQLIMIFYSSIRTATANDSEQKAIKTQKRKIIPQKGFPPIQE